MDMVGWSKKKPKIHEQTNMLRIRPKDDARSFHHVFRHVGTIPRFVRCFEPVLGGSIFLGAFNIKKTSWCLVMSKLMSKVLAISPK